MEIPVRDLRAAQGREFQRAVGEYLGIPPNSECFAARRRRGDVTRVRPDFVGRSTDRIPGVIEVKDRGFVCVTAQLDGEAGLAEDLGVPFILIVRHGTEVSRPLQDLVLIRGGCILAFDSRARVMAPWQPPAVARWLARAATGGPNLVLIGGAGRTAREGARAWITREARERSDASRRTERKG